jgi:copper chaperone
MISFSVKDMTCGHCVSSITKAVEAVDPGAQVRADVASHRVDIEPKAAHAGALRDAIQQAGYSPVAIDADPVVAAAAPAHKGCCCH